MRYIYFHLINPFRRMSLRWTPWSVNVDTGDDGSSPKPERALINQ